MSRPSSPLLSAPRPSLTPQQREWAEALQLDLASALIDPEGCVHTVSTKDGNEWWLHPEHKAWAIVGHKSKRKSIAAAVAEWRALDLKLQGWGRM